MAIGILSVEDEETIHDLVSTHQGLQGYEVKTAANGDEAVTLLESKSFDLILLEIEMPKMDGLEVQTCIGTRHIGVRPIMLTDAGDIHASGEWARWGAFDYPPKPNNFHELMDSIERVLAEGVHNGQSENVTTSELRIVRNSGPPGTMDSGAR
jgi:DNA-binding NtrC family response regulator